MSDLALDGNSQEAATLTILLVEDDPAFRYLCQRALEATDRYSIIEVENATDALAVIAREHPDGVLIDHGLPDMTGTELIEQIRKIEGDRSPPMILMTSGGNERIAAEALRVGAVDYISKQAVSQTSLARVFSNAVEKERLRMAHHERSLELEVANTKLNKRNDEISRFYHNISHEIKTPLTAANMFLSMLGEELVGPLNEQQHEIVEQALQSCEELTKHLNALIDSTRLEAGKLELELEVVSLRKLVERSVASVTPAALDKNISLNTEVAQALPDVYVDGGRIVQVLANLLGNAVKFTNPGGAVQIVVGLASENREVEIRVSDNGIGIDESNVVHVFDRLYQISHKGDAQLGAGLGLGLTIAKEIVALHGGHIDVTSQLGIGTTFTVRLPLTHPSGNATS